MSGGAADRARFDLRAQLGQFHNLIA